MTSPSRIPGGKGAFAVVASQYNAMYVQGLIDHTEREIMKLMPEASLALYQVPGAFEIPVVAQEVAMGEHGRIDAVIALGVIIKGETDHARHIAASVTDALQQVALRTRVPIIHEVLSVQNEAQARVRCLELKFNRGTEAARAAVSIANLMAELKASG